MSLIKILFKKASLKSDMVTRIMHSALIGAVPKSQYALTDGVIDEKIFDDAVKGAIDVIKYGTISCLGECQNAYLNNSYSNKLFKNYNFIKTLNKKEILDNINFIIEQLEICKLLFLQTQKWDSGFGGKKWADIANILLDISTLYRNLLKSKEDYKQATNIKKQILLKLNVFDGLAHNTGTVYTHMLEEEIKENNSKAIDYDINNLNTEKNHKIILQGIKNAYNLCLNYLNNYIYEKQKYLIENKIKNTNNTFDFIKDNFLINFFKQKANQNNINNVLDILNTIEEIFDLYQIFDVDFNKRYTSPSVKLTKNENIKYILDKINVFVNVDFIKESPKKYYNSIYDTELSKINEIMNFKDLKNQEDVFKSLEPYIKESGDLVKYKDYIHKFKNEKFYNKDPNELFYEIDKIKLNKTKNDIDELIEEVDKKIKMVDRMGDDKKDFANYYGDISHLYKNIIYILNGFQNKLKSSKIKKQISNIRSYMGYITDPNEFYIDSEEYGQQTIKKDDFNKLWTKAMDEISKLKFMILELFI